MVAERVKNDEVKDLMQLVQAIPEGEKLLTCIQCGTCTASCPTGYAMDYPLRQLWRLILWGLKEEVMGSQTFWLCTVCASCTARCPRGIPLTETLLALKSYALQQGLKVPTALPLFRETLEEKHNISGDPNESRLIWSQNMERRPEGLVGKRKAEVVYFVGCVSSFYPQVYGIPQSLAQVMERAEVDFTTLGGEEWCCGYPLYAAGMGERVAPLAAHNLERVKEIGAKRVVFSCPSCYYAWKQVYPQIASPVKDLELLHATEFLARLIEERRVRLSGLEEAITYHDPCDLGRKSGVFDEPRFILEQIPGLELREMANIRESSLCCGGGGDVELFDAELSRQVAIRRVEQARETGASTIVSACQQCKRALLGGVRQSKVKMRVADISELVWKAMEERGS